MNLSRFSRVFPLLIAVSVLSGCASVGHDFKTANVSSLQLGQTRDTEYQAMFGKPSAHLITKNSDGSFDAVRYVYAYADMGSARARALEMEFRNGVLNAYNYVSSFDKDKTSVTADQMQKIERGVSKKDEVLRILGNPCGKALCPCYLAPFKDKCGKGTEIWTWTAMEKLSTFGHAFGGDQIQSSTLIVAFDKAGVVTEVESEQTKKE
jgi:outer membrane protein assembly factor BamE (lipoprotein component of BamABCDE complex)